MAAAGGSNTFAGGLANAPYYVILTDGSGNVISATGGGLNVSVVGSVPLPTGAATSALQANGNQKTQVWLNVIGQGLNNWTGVTLGGGVYVGQIDLSSVGGTAVLPTALNTDGISGAQNAVPVGSFGFGWNGATWDRIKATGGAVNVASASQYPAGAIPVVAAGTGTTGAVTATLPAAAGKTTYICGFTIMAAATSLATGTATLAGLVGGVTFTYDQTVAAAANGTSKLTETFAPGIPASGTNTGIVVTSAAAGIGGVTDVNVWGYQL